MMEAGDRCVCESGQKDGLTLQAAHCLYSHLA